MRQYSRHAAVIFALGVAFDLVLDLLGTRQVVSETLPIVTAFLPHIGLGVIGGVSFYVYNELKKIDTLRGETTISDLQDFVKASKIYNSWLESAQFLADHVDPDQIPALDKPEMEHRYKTLGSKYSKWLEVADKNGNATFNLESEKRAIQYAEIIRAHGYFKGRRYIYKERRKASN